LVASFYFRAVYFGHLTQKLSYSLAETHKDFDEYLQAAVEIQIQLQDDSHYIYHRLNDEQSRAQFEISQQKTQHEHELDAVQSVIYEMERQIHNFEAERLTLLEHIEVRAEQIPPIEKTLRALLESQEALYDELSGGNGEPATILGAHTSTTEAELHARLEILTGELEIQRLLYEDLQTYESSIEMHLRNFPTLMPIEDGVITSWFGDRTDPITGVNSFHEGVDIPAPAGTPILAAGGGTVTFSDWRGAYGNVVFIDHGDGLQTRYAHTSENLVAEGERVERGQVIAYVGSTGRSLSTHLHYEIMRNNVWINPLPFITEE
jgi:murein DD-endopeptidase MepM/ murein hydrolase activator NlpD